VIAPGAGLSSGYGTLNLMGGLTTDANTTLLFSMGSTAITSVGGVPVYGGDLINLGGSSLVANSGDIAFVTTLTKTGDYRLFHGTSTSGLNSLTLPAWGQFTWTTTADPGYTDLDLLNLVVLSGGTWTAAGGGSWGTAGNWANSVIPSSGTVTFGSAITAPATVTLDAARSAGALVFSNTAGYTIANGLLGPLTLLGPAPSISVASGTHKIAADLALGGNLTVNAGGGDEVELAGHVSDGGAGYRLTLTGNGDLVLSGTGNYGGPTTVDGGTMYVASPTALPNGNALIIGAGGNFTFDPNQAFAPVSGNAAVSPHGIGAVPEPGTLALLAAGALAAGGIGVWRRRRASYN
jgi:autotransporter-associated beta strand protein